MVHLPAEILHPILCDARYDRVRTYLAPLATVNRHWKSVVEGILWKDITIDSSRRIFRNEIDDFQRLFSADPSRRSLLQTLRFRVDEFIWDMKCCKMSKYHVSDDGLSDSEESESGDDTDADVAPTPCRRSSLEAYDDRVWPMETRVSALRRENAELFARLQRLWTEIADWRADARLTEIQFIMENASECRFLGNYYQTDARSERVVAIQDWLSSSEVSQLPLLPTVQTFSVSDWGCRSKMWPVLLGLKLANSLPSLKELTIHGEDNERAWPHFYRQIREGEWCRSLVG
jgi:hypothetical protein